MKINLTQLLIGKDIIVITRNTTDGQPKEKQGRILEHKPQITLTLQNTQFSKQHRLESMVLPFCGLEMGIEEIKTPEGIILYKNPKVSTTYVANKRLNVEEVDAIRDQGVYLEQ